MSDLKNGVNKRRKNVMNKKFRCLRKKFGLLLIGCMVMICSLIPSKLAVHAEESDLRLFEKTDSLSKANSYHMYSALLYTGDYLQAKLVCPQDKDADFDLLLCDEKMNIVKTSSYGTYMHNNKTEDENLGYKSDKKQQMYILVYCSSIGKNTGKYTLTYSMTKNGDENEINDNASEAKSFELGTETIVKNGTIDSPADVDWYKIVVPKNYSYDMVGLELSNTSKDNQLELQLYQNIANNGYAMYQVGRGNRGDIELPAGEYYLKVVTTTSAQNFNRHDIPSYKLQILPVIRPDKVNIIELNGYHGTMVKKDYNEGVHYRIDETKPNAITITGQAIRVNDKGEEVPASNAVITIRLQDREWKKLNREDMADTEVRVRTDGNGRFVRTVQFNSTVGGASAQVRDDFGQLISIHTYDYITIKILNNNNSVLGEDSFYVLKTSEYQGL